MIYTGLGTLDKSLADRISWSEKEFALYLRLMERKTNLEEIAHRLGRSYIEVHAFTQKMNEEARRCGPIDQAEIPFAYEVPENFDDVFEPGEPDHQEIRTDFEFGDKPQKTEGRETRKELENEHVYQDNGRIFNVFGKRCMLYWGKNIVGIMMERLELFILSILKHAAKEAKTKLLNGEQVTLRGRARIKRLVEDTFGAELRDTAKFKEASEREHNELIDNVDAICKQDMSYARDEFQDYFTYQDSFCWQEFEQTDGELASDGGHDSSHSDSDTDDEAESSQYHAQLQLEAHQEQLLERHDEVATAQFILDAATSLHGLSNFQNTCIDVMDWEFQRRLLSLKSEVREIKRPDSPGPCAACGEEFPVSDLVIRTKMILCTECAEFAALLRSALRRHPTLIELRQKPAKLKSEFLAQLKRPEQPKKKHRKV